MARQQKKTGGQHKRSTGKPGSDPAAAQKAGGKGDFGVPVDQKTDRNYASQNTKAADRGSAHPRSGEDERRDSGAGKPSTGPGSASGGDVDTDLIGVGTGGSTVSQSGSTHRPPGPDDSTGTSDEFASGPHAQGKRGSKYGKIDGSVAQPPADDVTTGPAGQGADAASNPAAQQLDLDDSFDGEISSGEASGQDSTSRSDRPD